MSDLEPTLDFLAAAAATDLPDGGGSLWETRYVGMLWMSLICMIPFDLKRIDSAVGTGKVRADQDVDHANGPSACGQTIY